MYCQLSSDRVIDIFSFSRIIESNSDCMKRKLLLLGALIFLFVAFVLARILIFDRKPAQGSLRVLSSPQSTIFIDNKNVGKTPYEGNIGVGEHILKLAPEGEATDTASWSGKITINKNTRTFVDRELGSSDVTSSGVIFSLKKSDTAKGNEGEIEIESEPAGGIVYLDNDEKGIAPLIMENVSKGEHELSVYSPGFIRRSQKINSESGYRIFAQFKLAVDPTYQKVEDTTDEESTKSATLNPTPAKEATPSAKPGALFIVVRDTPTGWLRVRAEPSASASESAKINPGDKFEVQDQQSGWYKIIYQVGKMGWVSGQYVDKVQQ